MTQNQSTFDPAVPLPALAGACLPKVIAALAARRPDAVALRIGPHSMTYHDLDCQSNRLARELRKRGFRADLRVGVCLEDSLELALGVLGILKSGATCVWMNPAESPEVLEFIYQDSSATLLLTNSQIAGKLSIFPHDQMLLDQPHIDGLIDHSLKTDLLPQDLAYIVYAPRADGRPQPLAITHAELPALFRTHERNYADRVPSFAWAG